MTIGELTKASGANRETVRYYEEIGLLPDPQKNSSGYRVYNSDTIKRLMFIRRAKELGFTLNEIRTLIRLSTGEINRCSEVQEFVTDKVSRIRGQIKRLQALELALDGLRKQCALSDRIVECPALDTLISGGIKNNMNRS
ncbi:MAG: heavy metal-responsive transcriptional regulator [Candidatus Zixiibacteriota bacterium]